MSLILISFIRKINVVMSGFWEVGEEGVGDMIWQVSNESYEAKLGEWKKLCTEGGHEDFNDLLPSDF